MSGAVALPASGLEFYVDIDADGDWSVIIAQPLAMSEDIRVPPVSASGTGDQVICPVELGGGETVAGTHSGSGNFIVEAIPDDAFETFEVELLFNELDSFDGETVATTEYVCWLDVMAGGGWSLDIE